MSFSVLGFLSCAMIYTVGIFCFKKADLKKMDRRAAVIFSLPVFLSCFLPLVVRGEFFLTELAKSEAAVVLVSILLITVSSIRLLCQNGDSAGMPRIIKSFMAGLLMVGLMFFLWLVMLNGLG